MRSPRFGEPCGRCRLFACLRQDTKWFKFRLNLSSASQTLSATQPDAPQWPKSSLEGTFDFTAFQVDWEGQVATCPNGVQTNSWIEHPGPFEAPTIYAKFPKKSCKTCGLKEKCTRGALQTLAFQPRVVQEA